jgi:hypothetical protein
MQARKDKEKSEIIFFYEGDFAVCKYPANY